MTIRLYFRLVGKAWSADHKVSLPTPFEAMTSISAPAVNRLGVTFAGLLWWSTGLRMF